MTLYIMKTTYGTIANVFQYYWILTRRLVTRRHKKPSTYFFSMSFEKLETSLYNAFTSFCIAGTYYM